MNSNRRLTIQRIKTSVAGGALALSTAACGSASASQNFPTRNEKLVLLHGSWHGGWAWYKTRPLLLNAGFDTFSPTFTGMGDRTRYGSSSTGLVAHIDEVARFIEDNDLTQVVLVGHSYAGIVLSGVAERIPQRIKRLVYLDAFVLLDGESAFTFFPPAVAGLFNAAAVANGGWGVPPLPTAIDDFLGPLGTSNSGSAADRAFLQQRLTLLPLATHAESLNAPTAKALSLPKTYISCLRFPNLDPVKARVRTQPNWVYKEIDTYHDCMITTPEVLATLLIEAATS
jgi:pimeloyl-ACP methyl ester carboxylesterase